MTVQMWSQLFESNETFNEINAKDRCCYRDGTSSFHDGVTLESIAVPSVRPRILLIDDEPMFGAIMKKTANHLRVPLTYCQRLEDIPAIAKDKFDVVIVDYDLGAATGIEIARYIEDLTERDLPMILVSQSSRKINRRSPDSIREFVHKKLGPVAIFDAAFEAVEAARVNAEIQKRRSDG